MTSYLNSLTSHYTSLKRLIPHSLSADADLQIDDVDESHVTRVLRAYYTEKGRPFPPWLPPDPRAPQKAPPALVSQPNNYGGFNSAPAGAGGRNSRGAGGLDDLFSSGPAPGPAAPPPQPAQPTSLRARRGMPSQPAQRNEPPPTARPLPSQRMGSNQVRGGYGSEPASSPSPSREQSAADRLKARMRAGGGSTSPAPQQSSPYERPSTGGSSRFASAGSAGSAASGGGYNQYSNGGSAAPAPAPSRSNPYQSSSTPQNRYGGGSSGGGGSKPFVGSSAPWSSGEDPYGGGSAYNGGGGSGYSGGGSSGGYAGGYSGRAAGLPSNPRRR